MRLLSSTLSFLFAAASLISVSASPIQKHESPVNQITPALTKRFGYSDGDPMRAVNLGGWLVIEPWITPSLFEQFENKPKDQQAVDEWTFCEKLGKEECKKQLQKHWDSFFTQEDLDRLANVGINHLRIPIGYWAFTENDKEPYVQGQVEYLEKAIKMAEKAKINVIIDIHGMPGSQNGFDNSGTRGGIHWQQTDPEMHRSMFTVQEIIKIAEKHGEVVDVIELVNEPANWGLDVNKLVDFYNMAYDEIRKTLPNVGVMIHDAFLPIDKWDELRNKKWHNVILDTHIYHVFTEGVITMDYKEHIEHANNDGNRIAKFNSKLFTVTGEWSLATTDCTKWLNGFGNGARWDGTLDGQKQQCTPGENCTCTGNANNDVDSWTDDYKKFLKEFAKAQTSAYEKGSGWVFWNFKAENSPQWDYLFLAEHGYMPNFKK